MAHTVVKESCYKENLLCLNLYTYLKRLAEKKMVSYKSIFIITADCVLTTGDEFQNTRDNMIRLILTKLRTTTWILLTSSYCNCITNLHENNYHIFKNSTFHRDSFKPHIHTLLLIMSSLIKAMQYIILYKIIGDWYFYFDI